MNHGCRKCRREGVKLFLKGEKCFSPKCPVALRPYSPGQHGPLSFSKMSEYGKQLREKQKVKKIYGLSENQLKNYYQKASKKSGDTSENLSSTLETRLDSVIFRSGFISSRSTVRQKISHRFFLVNDKIVDIPSIRLSGKDVIKIKDGKKLQFNENSASPSSWIKFNKKDQAITLLHPPTKDELELPFDINLVIEYYSR